MDHTYLLVLGTSTESYDSRVVQATSNTSYLHGQELRSQYLPRLTTMIGRLFTRITPRVSPYGIQGFTNSQAPTGLRSGLGWTSRHGGRDRLFRAGADNHNHNHNHPPTSYSYTSHRRKAYRTTVKMSKIVIPHHHPFTLCLLSIIPSRKKKKKKITRRAYTERENPFLRSYIRSRRSMHV